MKVICISVNDPTMSNHCYGFITIGRVYETSGGPAAQYTIMSDIGDLYDLATWRFVSLEEWRERQLKELGI